MASFQSDLESSLQSLSLDHRENWEKSKEVIDHFFPNLPLISEKGVLPQPKKSSISPLDSNFGKVASPKINYFQKSFEALPQNRCNLVINSDIEYATISVELRHHPDFFDTLEKQLNSSVHKSTNAKYPLVVMPTVRRASKGEFFLSENESVVTLLFVEPDDVDSYQQVFRDSHRHFLMVLPHNSRGIAITRQIILFVLRFLEQKYSEFTCLDQIIYFVMSDDDQKDPKILTNIPKFDSPRIYTPYQSWSSQWRSVTFSELFLVLTSYLQYFRYVDSLREPKVVSLVECTPLHFSTKQAKSMSHVENIAAMSLQDLHYCWYVPPYFFFQSWKVEWEKKPGSDQEHSLQFLLYQGEDVNLISQLYRFDHEKPYSTCFGLYLVDTSDKLPNENSLCGTMKMKHDLRIKLWNFYWECSIQMLRSSQNDFSEKVADDPEEIPPDHLVNSNSSPSSPASFSSPPASFVPVSSWSAEDVVEWLKSLKISEGIWQAFENYLIDGETLLQLTQEKITSIAPHMSLASTKKFLKSLDDLKTLEISHDLCSAFEMNDPLEYLRNGLSSRNFRSFEISPSSSVKTLHGYALDNSLFVVAVHCSENDFDFESPFCHTVMNLCLSELQENEDCRVLLTGKAIGGRISHFIAMNLLDFLDDSVKGRVILITFGESPLSGMNEDERTLFCHITCSDECFALNPTCEKTVREDGKLFSANLLQCSSSSSQLCIECETFPATITCDNCSSIGITGYLCEDCDIKIHSTNLGKLHNRHSGIRWDDVIVSDLRNVYQTFGRILPYPGALHSVSIESHFINLALVTKKEQEEDDLLQSDDLSHPDLIRPHDIVKVKGKIDLKDLFSTSKRVLLQGRAGVGKSTLSQYIAYHWAKKELWNDLFAAIFWIPLREVPQMIASWKVESGVSPHGWVVYWKYFVNIPQIKPEHVDLLLAKQSDRILWLLDGYDEISQICDSSDPKYAHTQQTLIALTSQANVLMTTRPGFFQTTIAHQICQFDSKIEITGLTEENISAYLSKHLSDRQNAKKILEYLMKNKTIYCLAHIPLNLSLLVKLLTHQKGEERLIEFPKTLTRLYSDLVSDWMVRHRKSRMREDLNESMKRYEDFVSDSEMGPNLALLECIAFEGMKNSNLLIGAETIKNARKQVISMYSLDQNVNLLRDTLAIGLLKELGQNEREEDRQYYFLHLTFQEYFAACWIKQVLCDVSHSARNDVEEFIRTKKYFPRYEIVLSFTSGLLYQHFHRLHDGLPIQRFFCHIESMPRDLVGCAHYQFLMRCFKEFDSLDHLPSDYIRGIVAKLENVIFQELQNTCFWIFTNIQLYPCGTSSLCDQIFLTIRENFENFEMIGSLVEWLAPHMTADQLEVLIKFINEKLNDQGWTNNNTISLIENIAPHLQDCSKSQMLEKMLSVVEKCDQQVQLRILKLVRKHIFQLQPEQKSNLFRIIFSKIDDPRLFIRLQTLELVFILNSLLNIHPLEVIFRFFLNNFNEFFAQQPFPSFFEHLLPHLKEVQVNMIFEELLLKLNHHDFVVRDIALSLVDVLIPHLMLPRIERLLEILLTKLNDENILVRNAAQLIIKNLLIRNPLLFENVIDGVQPKLFNTKWEVRDTALSFCKMLIPLLLPPHIEGLFESLMLKLNDENGRVQETARLTIEKLLLFYPQYLNRVIEVVFSKLKSQILFPSFLLLRNMLFLLNNIYSLLNLSQKETVLQYVSEILDENKFILNGQSELLNKLLKDPFLQSSPFHFKNKLLSYLGRQGIQDVNLFIDLYAHFSSIEKENVMNSLLASENLSHLEFFSVVHKLVPQLHPQDKKVLLERVLQTLGKSNNDLPLESFQLELLFPHFGSSQLDMVTKIVVSKLDEEFFKRFTQEKNCDKKERFLNLFEVLLPRLSHDHKDFLLKEEISKLKIFRIDHKLPLFLRKLIPHLGSSQIEVLFDEVVRLDSKQSHLEFSILEKLIPFINEQQMHFVFKRLAADKLKHSWLLTLFRENFSFLLASERVSEFAKLLFSMKVTLIFQNLSEPGKITFQFIDTGQLHRFILSNAEWEHFKSHFYGALKCESLKRGLSTRLHDYGTYSAPIAVPGSKKKTLLHLAAEHGNVEQLQELLKEKMFSVNDQDNEERVTPLMLACGYPQEEIGVEMAKLLIKDGADVDLFDNKNETVLDRLSSKIGCASEIIKNYLFIEKLLKASPKSSENGQSVSFNHVDVALSENEIWTAIVNDDVENLENHFTLPSLSAIHPERKLTPLQLAIEERSLRCVKFLFSQGADPNAKNPSGDDSWSILTKCLEQSKFFTSQSVKLFLYLLRERKARKERLDRAITAMFVPFNDIQTPSNVKDSVLNDQLSILLGMSATDIQNDYESEPMRLQYVMYLQDYKEIHHADGTIRIEGVVGNTLEKFLCLRIRLHLQVLMEGQTGKWSDLPTDERGRKLNAQDVLNRLQSEILTNLEIYWQEGARLAATKLPHIHQKLALKIIAKNIIQQCCGLSVGKEYSFFSGYACNDEAHCLFICLEKFTNDSVIIRVDNRWTLIERHDGKHHSPYKKPVPKLQMDKDGEIPNIPNVLEKEFMQPFYIGHLKLDDPKLKVYVTNCLKSLSRKTPEEAVKLMYPWPIEKAYHSPGCSDEREVCLKRWPSQPRQQDWMKNCTLSSHNFGVLNRLGLHIGKWLLNKELGIIAPSPQDVSMGMEGTSVLLFRGDRESSSSSSCVGEKEKGKKPENS